MKILPNNLIAWGTVAGVLLTAGSMLGLGIAHAVHLHDQVTAAVAASADHESRIRAVETNAGETRADVREIKTDVSWIRKYLDHKPQTASNP